MHIVIIGNGVAGTNAARFIRKWSDHSISMISDESKYAFSRTALMYIYMGHMPFENTKLYEDEFWKKNNIDLEFAKVVEIRPIEKCIHLDNGKTMNYDKVIIATGSKSNKFGWPGQNLNGVQGLYHLQDLENLENNTNQGIKKAVIVGGGLIGVELAEMLHSRGIPVTMLVRESSFWNNVLPIEESALVNRHLLDHGIDLRLECELSEIKGINGHVSSCITKSGENIECQFVGLTIGVSPNVSSFVNTGIEIDKGILVNDHLETSISDVYAIGDCAQLRSPQQGRRAIEAIWYTGRMMGQTVARHICKEATIYDPGIWFNSAKFFDIEYQVYGEVSPYQSEEIGTFYWQHSSKNVSLRINYDVKDQSVKGFNLMGIRFRHEVCEKWIKEKTHIKRVLEQLPLAYFDPEFYSDYTQEILSTASQILKQKVDIKTKSLLNNVISFLSKSQ